MFIVGMYGCGSKYSIKRTSSDDGSLVEYTVGNEIDVAGGEVEVYGSGMAKFGKRCHLDMKKYRDAKGMDAYSLLFKYTGHDEFNFYEGSSLTLIIDKRKFVLTSKGTLEKHEDEYYVTESIEYVVPRNVLRNMAKAERVEVTVSGEYGSLNGYFNAENFANVNRFIDECVEGDM